MGATLIRLAVVALTVLLLEKTFSRVRVQSNLTALAVAVVLSLLNFLLGWAVTGVTALAMLPAGILTFGFAFLLVPFVVNTVLLWLTDKALTSFEIRGFSTLLLASAAISLANWAVSTQLAP